MDRRGPQSSVPSRNPSPSQSQPRPDPSPTCAAVVIPGHPSLTCSRLRQSGHMGPLVCLYLYCLFFFLDWILSIKLHTHRQNTSVVLIFIPMFTLILLLLIWSLCETVSSTQTHLPLPSHLQEQHNAFPRQGRSQAHFLAPERQSTRVPQ